jgi:hypothetical protein
MGHRGDLDEVESPIASQSQRIPSGQHAELIPFGVNDPDLRYTDTMIEARAKIPRRTTVKLSVNRRSPFTTSE